MDTTMAPQIDPDRPKMVRADFLAPAPLVQDIEERATTDGYTKAELFRLCLRLGFATYCEQGNKMLINENLRKRKQDEET
jgi:hypothetical protein